MDACKKEAMHRHVCECSRALWPPGTREGVLGGEVLRGREQAMVASSSKLVAVSKQWQASIGKLEVVTGGVRLPIFR